MKNEIKELKAELLKVFSKFEENECEPEFEVGKWYKLYELDLLVLITEVSGITVRYIGFITPKRFEKNWFHIDYNGILATEQEVLTAFTNYFRSQGWVSGKTKFKSARHGNKYIYNEPLILLNGSIGSNPLGCLFDSDTLTLATKVEHWKELDRYHFDPIFADAVSEYEKLNNEKLKLQSDKETLLEACKWSIRQFERLADEGKYPVFLLAENGGDGIMPIVNAITKATNP